MAKALALVADDTSAVFKKGHVDIREVGPNDVALKVQFCGVCHSDLHQVRAEWPIDNFYPMVPGHEITGYVEQVGSNVKKFKVGDAVGVGCMVGSCRDCAECKQGLEQYCAVGNSPTYNGKLKGNLTFGGYSEKMVVDQDFVLSIPEGMDLAKAAPLLCAGITTYSPLVRFGALAGGSNFNVAVQGFGGLGHMAVKISKAMGNKVTVISRGVDKKKAAESLGASFINSNDKDQLKAAEKTFDLIISTVSGEFKGWNKIMKTIKTDGILALVGVPPKPLQLEAFSVIAARRSFAGSNIGGIKETQEMLEFCAKHGIYADITLADAKEINRIHCDLYEGQGDVFRYVLKIADTLTEGKWEVDADPRFSKQSWEVRANVDPVAANKHKGKIAAANTPSTPVPVASKSSGSVVGKALFCIALTSLAVAGGYFLGKRRTQ